ncbi:pimeloyl-ACP methyl ester carboxylesterase [Prauserella isguenensis]|uniref:Pimeloyl-ACP methyl ester carboxylesterase n=1 Tax=Prauserella isguenensis TaxID=1470180 RepID=A0A839S1V6_9PSEU|nr:pimeloyl-ACP methyl ester carboxylesterase [Prauserella isguenensis]
MAPITRGEEGTDGMPVLAGAEPFQHTGTSGTGVVLCHGFTETPPSMRPWGRHLAAEGHTVCRPHLPGHDTAWRECNRTTWQEDIVEPVDSRAVLDGIGTDPACVTEVVLHDSGHVATLDNDAPLLFERSSEFAAAGRQVGTK